MTPEQYERWKDFSLRMARHAFPTATEARRGRMVGAIEGFFSWYDDNPVVSQIVDWDNDPTYLGDEVVRCLERHDHCRYNRRKDEYIDRANRFLNNVMCCIRAGLDIASAPSCGVLGFTVGDLRRMYPEGLPDWVTEGYDPPITNDTADDAGVWL